jgi:hypothetical protein
VALIATLGARFAATRRGRRPNRRRLAR